MLPLATPLNSIWCNKVKGFPPIHGQTSTDVRFKLAPFYLYTPPSNATAIPRNNGLASPAKTGNHTGNSTGVLLPSSQ